MSTDSTTRQLLMEMYDRLFQHFGPRHWWPAESPLEVVIGAILTQNTAWVNVEKAIQNIKNAGALSIEALHKIPENVLAEWIRPSGYFNVKAKRLKAVIRFIQETYQGDFQQMSTAPLTILRNQLLHVYGIGNETADSILLYALNKPIFVVDAYTRRILTRHGLISPGASYEDIQRLFMKALPLDTDLFNEYHALIVETGKTYCKNPPRCETCPLSNFAKQKNTLA